VARQSEQEARSVARRLGLRSEDCVFAQQTTRAIDAGVFHNDVIATSNSGVLLYHELAFENSETLIELTKQKFENKTGEKLLSYEVSQSEFPIEEAVKTYLFNSQLLSIDSSGNDMEFVCPANCFESQAARGLIQRWIDDASNPIQRVSYLPLGQSMKNGGGPACLRLRVMLNQMQIQSLGDGFKLTENRLFQLRGAVNQWYSSSIDMSDLARIEFADHAGMAALKLSQLC
jgi:succinylarginine dihydrolase